MPQEVASPNTLNTRMLTIYKVLLCDQVGNLLAQRYENHFSSLSLGSSASRIPVSARAAAILFPWQPCYLSRDHLDPVTLARCCPGNQVFVFLQWKLCIVIIPSLGTGW